DVTARFGLSPRSLQRLFQRYVGVSPKWVLQRYRLHEAAARLAEGTSGTWAEVAVELGYFDQSPFIRDFTRAVGMTPVAYAAACARCQQPVSACPVGSSIFAVTGPSLPYLGNGPAPNLSGACPWPTDGGRSRCGYER